MPVTLIVEDGSNVTGANSWNALPAIKSYCLNRGADLSDTENDAIAVWAILATDWLEQFRDGYKGQKTNPTQPLQWPRTINLDASVWSEWAIVQDPRVVVDGVTLENDQIPALLVAAHCQLVLEQFQGVPLFTSLTQNRIIKAQTTGPLKTEYFDSADSQSYIPAVQAMLEPLLNSTGGFLNTVRV